MEALLETYLDFLNQVEPAPQSQENRNAAWAHAQETASIFNRHFESTHVFKQTDQHEITLPIISIGSGNGVAEKMIQDQFKSHRVICVDPVPESFTTYGDDINQCIRPHYATVNDLIAKEPALVNRCVVVLIWPLYTHPNKTRHQLPYDIEALVKLQPWGTYIFYDYTGASGSGSIIRWIDTQFPHLALKFLEHTWLDDDDSVTDEILRQLPDYNHAAIWHTHLNQTEDGFKAKRIVGLWMEQLLEPID